MLRKIKYKNFQSHSRYDLNLELVNCVVGPSDSGKSALLRGLRWLCLNRPDGLDFLKRDEKFVGVKLELEGFEILRKKGKASNEYGLLSGNDVSLKRVEKELPDSLSKSAESDEGTGQATFKAFGQEVPDPIKNLLNVSQVNFQTQFDPPFWIGLSAGQLSRELNGVVDLTLIDTVLGKVAADLKKSKLEAEISQERLQEATRRKQSLEWAKEADLEFRTIEEAGRKLGKLQQESDSLASLIESLWEYRKRKLALTEQVQDLSSLLELSKKMKESKVEVDSLTGLVSYIENAKSDLQSWSRKLESKNLELSTVKECPVCGSPLGEMV